MTEGEVRIGRRIGNKNPSYEGFKKIPVVTRSLSGKWFPLSPYCSRIDGCLMENVWQFSKIYEVVPQSTQRYSRWDNTITWDWPEERHLSPSGRIKSAYWEWREKGYNVEYPIRYPVGFKNKHLCVCSILENEDGTIERLNYVEARKRIYLKEYIRSIEDEPVLKDLRKLYKRGENLLIIDVDGPHQESLEYYQETYNVEDDFIENDTILCTTENMKILLNDTKHSFGHGYCLASFLLGIEEEIL